MNHQVHKRGTLITFTYCATLFLHYYIKKKGNSCAHVFSSSQRFVDICEGCVPRGAMVLMKDISLKDTNAAGQHLYYKLQDICWDEVLSKYILHPKVCSKIILHEAVTSYETA
jgi:hypothetical protein